MSLAGQGLRGLLNGLNLAKYYDVMLENQVSIHHSFEPLSRAAAQGPRDSKTIIGSHPRAILDGLTDLHERR